MQYDELENRIQQLAERLREYRQTIGTPKGQPVRQRIAELWGEIGPDVKELGVPIAYQSSGRVFPIFETIVAAPPSFEMMVDETIQHGLACLSQAKGRVTRLRGEALQPQVTSPNPTTVTDEVFVVHGHDSLLRESVARYIEQLGLKAVILHEQTNRGRTIIEKLEQAPGVGYAVVLFTPDDFGYVATDPDTVRSRPRQNVLLELGFFWGKLGREHVCVLHDPDVELPSDLHGIVYISSTDGSWRVRLARELREAGYDIDANAALDAAG